jgi:Arc/MetJ family transcription regulator
MAEAMAATGLAKKGATVEEALRHLVRRRLAALADMAGLGWDGELARLRKGRDFGPSA